MKIALVQCPMFNVRMPQIGPAYLKSSLENNGYEVKQFDFNIELYNSLDPEGKKCWGYGFDQKWSMLDNSIFNLGVLSNRLLDEWAQKIIDADVDIIGFSVFFTSMRASRLLAKKIKRIDRHKTIIFGGPSVITSVGLESNADEITKFNRFVVDSLIDGVDILVIGEGEETLLEIVERLACKKSIDDCKGMITKKGQRIIYNGLRPLIFDLGQLPFPDFSILNSHTYTDRNFLPILVNRGCPNRCTFCDYPYLDRYKFRIRSAENVVDEIEYQKDRYSTELFHFNDSSINASIHFLSNMCDLIIERGISIRWGSSISIKRNMNTDLFIKMKKSGCEYLSFGIESASSEVLKSMAKKFTVEDIRQNLIDCYEAGIAPCTNWIVGYPTETSSDFQKTLDFIKESKKYIMEIDVNLCSIKLHTPLYNNMKKFRLHMHEGRDFDWEIEGGKNTLKIRQERLEIFKKNFPKLHSERI
ncbi:MAG: radical SAM protein [Candidatus Omnitrophica bacterium]|nr:radical SAM protein [Candidatus Omnitrophota bacterium]